MTHMQTLKQPRHLSGDLQASHSKVSVFRGGEIVRRDAKPLIRLQNMPQRSVMQATPSLQTAREPSGASRSHPRLAGLTDLKPFSTSHNWFEHYRFALPLLSFQSFHILSYPISLSHLRMQTDAVKASKSSRNTAGVPVVLSGWKWNCRSGHSDTDSGDSVDFEDTRAQTWEAAMDAGPVPWSANSAAQLQDVGLKAARSHWPRTTLFTRPPTCEFSVEHCTRNLGLTSKEQEREEREEREERVAKTLYTN